MQRRGLGEGAGSGFEKIGDVVAGERAVVEGVVEGAGGSLGTVDLAERDDFAHVMDRIEAALLELAVVLVGAGGHRAQTRSGRTRAGGVRFLALVEEGGVGAAAERLDMTQPGVSRFLARLEREFGAALFERTTTGVHPSALGATLAEPARTILPGFDAARDAAGAAHAGHEGPFRITACPVWFDAVLPRAIARFRNACPGVELRLDAASRAEGLRLLAAGAADLHCGGERLPAHLRRERFVDLTAGISAEHRHPLLARAASLDDLARCPWVDYDAPAELAAHDPRPSLPRLLAELHRRTLTHVRDVVRTGSAGLLLLTTGPYLAWLVVELVERLSGAFVRPLPLDFGRFRYRSGFVARRSAEKADAFRRLEALVRETALGRET